MLLTREVNTIKVNISPEEDASLAHPGVSNEEKFEEQVIGLLGHDCSAD